MLCDVGDVEGMAKGAEHILSEDALSGFKLRAKLRAQQFTIHAILPQYLKVYAEALHNTAS